MNEQKYNLDQSLAELDKLVDLSAKETDKTACEALAEKARTIYEQYPESEDIALRYARILFNLSVEQENVEDLLNTTKEVKQIFDSFKHSEDIALHYTRTLANLSFEQENVEDLLNTTKEVKQIFDSFKHSEDIALHYAMALANLSFEQENVEDLLNTVNSVKQIFDSFKHSESIALHYAMALVNLSAKQDQVEDLLKTSKAVKQIFEQFKDSEDIALQYAMVLYNLSNRQNDIKERKKTISDLEALTLKFQHSENIVLQYAMALVNLSVEQDNVEERLNTVNEVKQIFDSFKHSESIALRYAMALVNLSAKQDNVEDRLNTVNEVKQIFDSFKHSESIALRYVKVLYNLSNLQNDLNQTNLRVIEILDILKNFSNVEILDILVKILQNSSDIKLDTDKIPTTSLTKILDKLCLNSNINTDRDLLIRALNLKLTSGRRLVVNTKYDILNDWIEYYKDVEDKDKLNQLIDIYRIVQEIKFKLGLKEDNKKLQFGHYTKGATLQVILKQEENEKKEEKEEKEEKKHIFSVSGKTRLYNASYMNDPEEGLVIEKVLKSNKEGKISSYFEKRDILDPSSWFLMSFTSKTDDLAMWSQYGDDAQGVCLVLKEDDFSRFTSFNDVSWRKETLLLESENKSEVAISELSSDFKSSPNKLENNDSSNSINRDETQLKSEKKDNVSKGNIDYLYRIAYIGKDFKLEKSELFDDDEINKLDESVNNLKQKLYERLYENDDFYKNAISECIEEIRYLFKSVDYKYENELRILRYANLDPSNDKIKIDKESGIGKLYVERENPIQIEEVIFGPKFPNPEYVTPLLKLLDNDIKYKKSTIKFR